MENLLYLESDHLYCELILSKYRSRKNGLLQFYPKASGAKSCTWASYSHLLTVYRWWVNSYSESIGVIGLEKGPHSNEIWYERPRICLYVSEENGKWNMGVKFLLFSYIAHI